MEVDSRKEVFGLFSVVEPSFFDHRKLRMKCLSHHWEDSGTVSHRGAFSTTVHLDSLDSARG